MFLVNRQHFFCEQTALFGEQTALFGEQTALFGEQTALFEHMCDALLHDEKSLYRLFIADKQDLKDVLYCCADPSILEETLLVIVISLIVVSCLSLILLTGFVYSEGRAVKLRARRRSRVMSEDYGFVDSLAQELENGLPMSETVVKGFNEIKESYLSLPCMYAERGAIRFAQETSDFEEYVDPYYPNSYSDAESVWRSIVETPPKDEEDPDAEDPLQNITIDDEGTISPWGNHWDNIKCKIRKLSELRRNNPESRGNSFEIRTPKLEESVTQNQDFSEEIYARIVEREHSFCNNIEHKRKKMSEASVVSNYSVSSISLSEEIYEELPRAHKGILSQKSIHDKDRRFRRKRRHGVCFVEGSPDMVFSYSSIGTV